MKPKEVLFLVCAFFLGYFANTVISSCSKNVMEGNVLDGTRPVGQCCDDFNWCINGARCSTDPSDWQNQMYKDLPEYPSCKYTRGISGRCVADSGSSATSIYSSGRD
jgi:hypothetical protein